MDTIDRTVCDSVKAHQIADVEVGSFLSSVSTPATYAAVARPAHVFDRFSAKGTYNESQQAGELAKLIDLNNTAEALTDEEAFAAFPRIQWHLDEPVPPIPSCVPLYFLSALAGEGSKSCSAARAPDRTVRRIHRLRRAHQVQADQGVVTRWLTHLPAGARKAIARFCKGQDLPGRMASGRIILRRPRKASSDRHVRV